MNKLSSLGLTLALIAAAGLIGLAPSAAAECSFDCAGCDVAVGPNRFDGGCFVGGSQYYVDSCLLAYSLCGDPMAWCGFSVGHGSPVPDCEGYAPGPLSECVDYWRGPNRGVCVDTARPDCKAWHYDHNRELCLVPVPQG